MNTYTRYMANELASMNYELGIVITHYEYQYEVDLTFHHMYWTLLYNTCLMNYI